MPKLPAVLFVQARLKMHEHKHVKQIVKQNVLATTETEKILTTPLLVTVLIFFTKDTKQVKVAVKGWF